MQGFYRLVATLAICLTLLSNSTLAQSTSSAVNAARLQTEYRTVADIMSLIDQIKPDPERVQAYQTTLSKSLPPADAYWFTKRDALLQRMDAAESLGNIKLRLEAAEAIMAIFKERKDINREMEFAFSYAGILREAGQTARAIAIEEEMVRSPQSYAHWVMSYHNRRSNEFTAKGNLEAAKPHYDAANAEFHRHQSYTTMPNTFSANQFLNARYKRAEGKYAEAEAHYLNAAKATQNWVDNMGSVAGSARHALPSNRGYAAYLGYRLDYVSMLLDLGRVTDAERVARQPLLWALERMGKYSPHAVRASAAYASVLGGQGRHIEAEKLARASLEMAAGIGAEPDSLFMREAYLALARALLGQGRIIEADTAFQLVPLGANTVFDAPRAVAAILNGRAAAVISALQIQAEHTTVNIGPQGATSSALVGEARALYAMALGAVAQDATGRQAAIAQFRSAVAILLASRQQNAHTEDAMRVKLREWMLQSYLALLAQQSGDGQSIADSFVVADWLRGSSTQGAVAASAARAAVSEPQLAAAVRREQDIRTELVSMHRAMQRLSTLSPEQLKEASEDPTALRSRIDALTREHNSLFADITKRFPKYANLIQPQPPSLQDAQAALKAGEVLISILVTPQNSFVWAVPAAGHAGAGGVIFRSSNLGERDIDPMVKSLRAAVDVGNKEPSFWPTLDVAASYRLYRELLEPVKAAFSGASTLIVVANGSLASLPPSLLVTAPHELGKDTTLPFDRYAAVPWLDKQYATAQIPSVNSLVSLRQAVSTPAVKAFTGFGDPVFSSQAASAVSATRGLRNAATTRPDAISLRANQSVAWMPYSKLAPLPDTRDEVLAIAKALGADLARDVVLGKDVTKQRVKQTDLSSSRIVAFATHGLIPGDFPGVDQPSLALSVPEGKDADKEPIEALLTLEDVLQLKLNADWVVLSACNTAAADGQGSEAVSGLGRGFFYAGSKALLVTHWPVDSASAKDLVSHIFSAYAKDASLTRAKALQGAMRQVRSATVKDGESGTEYSLAHPLFWAPYALVGEPGR